MAVLYLDLYDEGVPPEEPASRLPQRLCEFFLIAEVRGKIVGFVIGERCRTAGEETGLAAKAFPDDDWYLEVQDLYVAPEARGIGVGSALMQHLLDRARHSGLARSMVYSANTDRQAIARFYERFGYRILVDSHRASDGGEPHIFLTQ